MENIAQILLSNPFHSIFFSTNSSLLIIPLISFLYQISPFSYSTAKLCYDWQIREFGDWKRHFKQPNSNSISHFYPNARIFCLRFLRNSLQHVLEHINKLLTLSLCRQMYRYRYTQITYIPPVYNSILLNPSQSQLLITLN